MHVNVEIVVSVENVSIKDPVKHLLRIIYK
jgi:hypothetical protein